MQVQLMRNFDGGAKTGSLLQTSSFLREDFLNANLLTGQEDQDGIAKYCRGC